MYDARNDVRGADLGTNEERGAEEFPIIEKYTEYKDERSVLGHLKTIGHNLRK